MLCNLFFRRFTKFKKKAKLILTEIKKTELIYFQELKIEIKKEAESKLNIRKELKDWSGADIQTFQIDLEEKCKSTVSEKWVYLHFKNESEKLPRIDVLNLLSKYCGFAHWDDFRHQKTSHEKQEKVSKVPILLGASIIAFAMISALIWFTSKPNKRVVILKDAYTQNPVSLADLRYRFGKNEPNMKEVNAAQGILEFNITGSDTLKIDGPYYKSFSKYMINNKHEDTLIIKLYPDDYAMMLNYFSRTEQTDWQKRRDQLHKAIHEEAIIFQSHPKYDGIEILNKEEFIERLLLPINSLKNLEIQDIVYKENQIYNLRFVQKDK